MRDRQTDTERRDRQNRHGRQREETDGADMIDRQTYTERTDIYKADRHDRQTQRGQADRADMTGKHR